MTIFDLLDQLAPLRGTPAAIIIVAAAFASVVLWDMRLAVAAFGIHYLVSGLLYVEILDPRLAVAYALSGLVVVLIIMITAYQIDWGRPPSGLTAAELAAYSGQPSIRLGRWSLSNRSLLRIGLSLAALLVTIGLGWPGSAGLTFIPSGQAYIDQVVFSLGLLGLVGLATSPGPLPSGMGLLIFLNGFAMFYSALDPSITMVVALITIQLLVAIVTAYLAQAQYWPVDSPD